MVKIYLKWSIIVRRWPRFWMPVHIANWWKNQCSQHLACSGGWLRVWKMVGDDRICMGSYFTILIVNLCMQYIFKKLIPWILMSEHDENQLNLVVKPFARNQYVWEFREINYCGWWNVGLCVQSWHKATISTEEFRIVTQAVQLTQLFSWFACLSPRESKWRTMVLQIIWHK